MRRRKLGNSNCDDNVNDNHSDVVAMVNKASKSVDARHLIRNKQRRQEESVDSSQSDMEIDQIAFEENNNVVQITVDEGDRSQFPSEDERDSEQSETEEGEVIKDETLIEQVDDRRIVKNKPEKSWRSVEDKLDDLSSTLKNMQEMMIQKGIFEEFENSQKRKRMSKDGANPKRKASGGENLNNSYSETMIYQQAIEKQVEEEMETGLDQRVNVDQEISFKVKNSEEPRRGSSSSEDRIDESDELMEVDNFIADCEAAARHASREVDCNDNTDRMPRSEVHRKEYRGDETIREVEASKVCLLNTPGKSYGNLLPINTVNNLERIQTTSVDENYMMLGFIEESLFDKIIKHEYVDFARLIPKDKLLMEEDNRMELVSRGGSTFFVPVADRETQGNNINSFNKWEQAFRVFSNMYTKVYPDRANQLIQYNHLIYTASLSFIWENIYRYDKEFRLHMSNYPQRSWSVILQQAWSIYLKDRINFQDGGSQN